jgi:hypothetical protein
VTQGVATHRAFLLIALRNLSVRGYYFDKVLYKQRVHNKSMVVR